jgi:hypothetical protein
MLNPPSLMRGFLSGADRDRSPTGLINGPPPCGAGPGGEAKQPSTISQPRPFVG